MFKSHYLEWIRIRFLMMLAYRVNYYSGILIYSLNIGAYYFIWQALYGNQTSMGGLTFAQMTTYIAVGWMARSFYFNNIDNEMAQDIKQGKIAIELIRPYNYLLVKLMQGFGEGLFRLLFFSVPGMAIVVYLFSLEIPLIPQTWLFYGISIFFSFLINTQISLLVGISAFFLLNNEGLLFAKRYIIDLFSGLVIPIMLFPEWAQWILKFLPFQGISYLPSMIFNGKFQGEQVTEALLLQVMWVVLLVIPVTLLWKSARRKLEVQGG